MVKFSYVFHYVKDKDWRRTINFYKKLLGKKPERTNKFWCEWIFYNRFRFALHWIPNDFESKENTFVGFATTNINELTKKVEKIGGKQVGELKQESFGILGEIKDPAGNCISVYQPSAKKKQKG
jgi:predicted enzyme related to lactoylglutathione lyase